MTLGTNKSNIYNAQNLAYLEQPRNKVVDSVGAGSLQLQEKPLESQEAISNQQARSLSQPSYPHYRQAQLLQSFQHQSMGTTAAASISADANHVLDRVNGILKPTAGTPKKVIDSCNKILTGMGPVFPSSNNELFLELIPHESNDDDEEDPDRGQTIIKKGKFHIAIRVKPNVNWDDDDTALGETTWTFFHEAKLHAERDSNSSAIYGKLTEQQEMQHEHLYNPPDPSNSFYVATKDIMPFVDDNIRPIFGLEYAQDIEMNATLDCTDDNPLKKPALAWAKKIEKDALDPSSDLLSKVR